MVQYLHTKDVTVWYKNTCKQLNILQNLAKNKCWWNYNIQLYHVLYSVDYAQLIQDNFVHGFCSKNSNMK